MEGRRNTQDRPLATVPTPWCACCAWAGTWMRTDTFSRNVFITIWTPQWTQLFEEVSSQNGTPGFFSLSPERDWAPGGFNRILPHTALLLAGRMTWLPRWEGGNIGSICWQLAPCCVPHTDIHLPPMDTVFDIFQSARGPLSPSQLLLLVPLSRKEQPPRDLGSQFIIRMIVAFAGTQKLGDRWEKGKPDASTIPPLTNPAGPRLEPSLYQEGAEAWPGERQVTITTSCSCPGDRVQ